MSLRLSGRNQLSYVGVEPLQPPDLVVIERNPISGNVANADYRNFNVGTFWLNPTNLSLWVLVLKNNNTPFWLPLGISAVGLVQQFTTDDAATVSPVAGNVNVFGGTNINTTGATPTITINLDPNINVTSVTTGTLNVTGNASFGGAINTILGRGVVQSPGGGGPLFSSEGTNGQVLISSSAGAPLWRTLTAGANVTITNGANSITIAADNDGADAVKTLTGNTGIATAVANNINIETANSTVTFVGAGDTVTQDFADGVNQNLVLGSSLPTLGGGQNNTGVGYAALFSLIAGDNNTGIGSNVLFNITNGDNNVALGDFAGNALTIGDNNIMIGRNAGSNITDEDNNILIGSAGTVGVDNSIKIGTFGSHTTAFLQGIVGNTVSNAGLVTVNQLTGQLGVASGSGPLNALNGNTGTAAPSGGLINVETANTTITFDGSGNTLLQDFGLSSILIGSPGAFITTASNNAGLGLLALLNVTSGSDNIAVGVGTLQDLTTGSRNTALGYDVLTNITTQNDNTGVGYFALQFSTGSNNTAVGASSLENLLTGVNNIALGRNAGNALTSNESNNILIGTTGTATDSGRIRIGTSGTHTSAFIQGVAGVAVANTNMVTINTVTGQLGSQVVPSGVADISLLQADDGNQAGPTPGGVVFVEGGTNINTTAPIPNTLIINLDNNISVTSVTASGNITSSAGNITATAGNVTAGGNLSVGGSVLFTAFAAGMLVSDNSGNISSINTFPGRVPISRGAGNAPAWGQITSTGGTITVTTTPTPTINLEVSGTIATPAAGCSFMAVNGATQTINAGPIQTVNFPSVVYNNGVNYNGGTSTFTAPATGLYYFSFSAGICGGSPKSGRLHFVVNGSAFTLHRWTTVDATTLTESNSVVIDLVAGDTVFVGASQESGAFDIQTNFGAPYITYFVGYRLT